PPRPGVSPYLGLLAGGNPAVNYYSIVRPQMEFRSAIAGLQMQQGLDTPANVDPTDPLGPGVSGHPAYFDNLSHYYPVAGPLGRGGYGAVGVARGAPADAFGVGLNRGVGPNLQGYMPQRPTGGMFTPR